MAHNFAIKNTKKDGYTFFFGYANGLMYRAFGEQKHDAVFSGDNGEEIKTKKETEEALDNAIKWFDMKDYPDPTRMDEIKQFRKDMDNDAPDSTYLISYS